MFSKQDLANMLIVFFLMDHLGNVSNQTLLNSTAVNPTQTVSHLSWKDIWHAIRLKHLVVIDACILKPSCRYAVEHTHQ